MVPRAKEDGGLPYANAIEGRNFTPYDVAGQVHQQVLSLFAKWGQENLDEIKNSMHWMAARVGRETDRETLERNIGVSIINFPKADEHLSLFFGFQQTDLGLLPTIFLNSASLEIIHDALPAGVSDSENVTAIRLLSKVFDILDQDHQPASEGNNVQMGKHVVVRAQLQVALHLAALYFDAKNHGSEEGYFGLLEDGVEYLSLATSMHTCIDNAFEGIGKYNNEEEKAELLKVIVPHMYRHDPGIEHIIYLLNHEDVWQKLLFIKDKKEHEKEFRKLKERLQTWYQDPWTFIQTRAAHFGQINERIRESNPWYNLQLLAEQTIA